MDSLFVDWHHRVKRKACSLRSSWREYDMIRLQKGFAPILLLDDVFEKLDDQPTYITCYTRFA
ncbi:MAG: hypothetical protein U0T56_09295 [Ferruginibacter sp.]